MTVADSGDTGPRTAPARALAALAFACSFVVCLLAAGALAITLLGSSGEPVVSLNLTPGPHKPAAPPRKFAGEEFPAPPPGVPVTKPIYAGSALIADPALIENTAQGPLPRIADDGRKPMTAYAAPAASGKLKIAIVMGGLGLSARATQGALDGLPAAITLGFLPYAGDVAHWVGLARARGHEVLLQVPMEPFDFPESDPGPHTLRAGQDEDANRQRLTWALTRFTGYAGVTNLLGQRFLSDADALAPTLTYLARRGLYFYDNGSAPQSVSPTVGSQIGMAFARGSVTLDTIGTALEIDRQLSALEAQAREKGSAVGSAYLYPVSVARIAAWAKGLQSRGFVLVPVSAIVSAPKQ
jgi:polysaccharide deacetylase 2 family uncharacterized protein YibQ